MSKYKLKTHSGAAKRFRRRGSGFKHRAAYRSHLLTDKSSHRKRGLRAMREVSSSDVSRVIKLMGG